MAVCLATNIYMEETLFTLCRSRVDQLGLRAGAVCAHRVGAAERFAMVRRGLGASRTQKGLRLVVLIGMG